MFNFPKRSKENQAISTFEELENQQQQQTKSMMNILFVLLVVIVFLCAIYLGAKVIEGGKHFDYKIEGVPSQQAKQQLEQEIQALNQSHYLTADMMQIRNTVLKHAWVDEVVVTRLWPNHIYVKVIPRQPVARWGKAGRLVNEQGEIFSLNTIQPATHLATLFGPNDQAKRILQTYQDVEQLFSPLGIHLVDVHLTERMTWLFQFDNGWRILVDHNNTMLKLQQLSYMTQHEFKNILPNIAGFDLRYRDGLAIQWKAGKNISVEKGKFLISPL